jgi:hypothetical protein
MWRGESMSRHLNGHLERLKAQIPTPEDKGAAFRRAVMRSVMNEFGRLKASRATNTFRGGVRVEPEDIPGKILGSGCTTGQMVELAIRRVFEGEVFERGELPDDRLDELVEKWSRVLEAYFTRNGRDWNKPEGGEG